MIGARRIAFACLAGLLRLLARAPLGLGRALAWLADRCEELAR